MSAPLIKLLDVCRRDAASSRLLLDGVSLDVFPGDRIGLTGPTGSGKSTLLRTIALLDRPASGQMQYQGRTVTGDQVPGFRRQVIYLSQRTALLPTSVGENLQTPFRFASATEPYDHDRAVTLLGQASGSAGLIDQQAESLSGGERQIVALVRALLLRPQMLLLDEPTTGLDAKSTERVEQLVLQWHRNESAPTSTANATTSTKRALLWTSHDRQQIQRVTDRSVTMRDGNISTEAVDG